MIDKSQNNSIRFIYQVFLFFSYISRWNADA